MLHPVGLSLVAVERGLPFNMREPIHRVAALVGEGADVAVERVEVVDHEVILQRLGDLRHRRDLPRQDGEKRIRPQLHVVPLDADDAVPLADVEEAGLRLDSGACGASMVSLSNEHSLLRSRRERSKDCIAARSFISVTSFGPRRTARGCLMRCFGI